MPFIITCRYTAPQKKPKAYISLKNAIDTGLFLVFLKPSSLKIELGNGFIFLFLKRDGDFRIGVTIAAELALIAEGCYFVVWKACLDKLNSSNSFLEAYAVRN